jgi:hypothetical protein
LIFTIATKSNPFTALQEKEDLKERFGGLKKDESFY